MRSVAAMAACAAASGAMGQSLNIDLGDTGSAPPASYAGAGLAGVWNTPDLGVGPVTLPLVGLGGGPTGATITTTFDRESVFIFDPLIGAADAPLMLDGTFGTGDVVTFMSIDGLAPGRYKVIGYGLTPNGANHRTLIILENPLTGESDAATIGAAWPGGLVAGVTHLEAGLNLPDGTLKFAVVGGFFGQSGFSNGLQLVKVCDADMTTAAIPGTPGYGVPNGTLNNDDFFYYLAAFGEQNTPVADLTTTAVAGTPGYGTPNGVLNNDDFFYYLALFAAGC